MKQLYLQPLELLLCTCVICSAICHWHNLALS